MGRWASRFGAGEGLNEIVSDRPDALRVMDDAGRTLIDWPAPTETAPDMLLA
jgi:hypothetical protein